jgi:hypothetical protein
MAAKFCNEALRRSLMKSLFQKVKPFLSNSLIRKLLFGSYIAIVLGFSINSRATELRFFPMPPAKQIEIVRLSGLLLSADNGLSGVLVVNDKVTAELVVAANTDLDLGQYHGQQVQVIATHSRTRIQPVIQSMNTLIVRDSGDLAVPTVFVLKIKSSL